jgi:hypothetical protein
MPADCKIKIPVALNKDQPFKGRGTPVPAGRGNGYCRCKVMAGSDKI